ncbi:nucleotidyltransferase domain-containing protein [Vibrio tubiashii]|uniref:nucleotidyltransferase domain-containing protein n=1 Tax=Vibrio tubiashii TaxID=29498 RepID=UPI003CE48693
MDEQDRGLDNQGFIRNVYASKNIQLEFKVVVDAVVSELCYRLPEQVDGIYLYGSVPRGNAIVGSSDLDVSIILTTPISQKEEQVFNELSAAIPKEYPEVSKLDIDPGYLNGVLESKEKYHWQFWLKHCCCCIWGNDLSARFSSYKPSIEIAQALNGDLLTFLEQMSFGYAGMSDANVAKVLGKKLLRAAYYFVAAKDCSWYTDLFQCVEVAKRYYPVQSDDLELAYQYATGRLASKSEAIELYERLSQNIVPS